MRAMTGPRLPQQAPWLLGRDRECAAIDALLADGRAGAAGALVVRGEAGIGKSALLDYAKRSAPPMKILAASGVQAESDLAFAGLHQLLRPILGYLGELPGTQAQALSGALGLGPSTQPDRLLISAAVLGLLVTAAEDHPVLCVIDDAQWVDRPSADALVFTARRLRAERLVILFGARADDERQFEAGGLAEITLAGLDQQSAEAVLAWPVQNAVPSVRNRLLAEAAGNPLALLELGASLPPEQLDGRMPLPDAIPLTPRLEGIFLHRTEQLPAPTQNALLIAAADNTGDAAIVLRAAAGLGLAADALDPAEEANLVQVTGATITFRHPLVRSALYQAATLSKRQRVHAALAVASTGEENIDRRVWHQAMATVTGDEEVAAAVEASARRSLLRAGHASAASAFLRAAELSTDEDRRVLRASAAAQAAWDAGQPARSREIIERVLPRASGESQWRLLHLSGVIEARTGSLQRACSRLLQGVASCNDPPLKLEMLMEAAEAAAFAGDFARSIELAAYAAPITAAGPRDKLVASLLGGFTKTLAGEHEQARLLFEAAIEQADTLDEPLALIWASFASNSARPGASLSYASRAVDLTRQQGLVSMLPRALSRLGSELLRMSQFDLAYAAAQEGYRLSLEVGYGQGFHLAYMAAVEAVWGREQDARRHAEEALALGKRNIFLASVAEETLGFIDLTLGRTAQAADRLLAMTTPGRQDIHPGIATQAIPDAVEAALRAGRREEAAMRLETYRAWVAAAPAQAHRALLARCEAVLGNRGRDQAFGEAIECAPALPPLQRARTDLLYGEWLRRERRRTEARVHLRAAVTAFQGLGATPWASRAEAELRATGETVRKRDLSAVDQLTPQELQIAGLVTQGLTNRDIAAQLYLSPRTIDYHLHKVFTKLGIASRAELILDGLRQDGPG